MSTKPDRIYDVIVAGGGPAGCALTSLLARSGLMVACVDRDDKNIKPAADGKAIAISLRSSKILESAGAWKALKGKKCTIRDIHITDNGSPTLLEFLANSVDEDAFGWVVEGHNIRSALFNCVALQKNAHHIAPSTIIDYHVGHDMAHATLDNGQKIGAKLIVGADGRNSFTRDWMKIDTRGWNYNQRAILSIVHHEKPHHNIAVEDFRDDGPFAILPLQDDEKGHRSSIVWTEHSHENESAEHWNDKTFLTALAERFPSLYGNLLSVGKKFVYPLSLSHAHEYIAPRMALVADAAHGIHPIAGQGLNLGLRDVATLADLVIEANAKKQDIGDFNLLQRYQRARRLDTMAMIAFTDTINKVFSSDKTPVKIFRKAGLRLIRKSTTAQKFLMRYAMGSGGLADKHN